MDDRSVGTDYELAGARPPTLLGSIRRYWWIVIPVVAGFVVLGFLFNVSQENSYQAVSEIIINDSRATNPFAVGDGAAPSNQASERYLADQVEILRSPEVAGVASELLDGEFSKEQVLLRRTISGDLTSNRIAIFFDAASPEAAKRGSDAVADAYVVVRRRAVQDTAKAALDKVDTLLANLAETIEELRQRMAVLRGGDETRRELVRQVEEARTNLNSLRSRRDATPLGSEQRASLNAQIDELLRDFQAWEIVLRVEEPDSELATLLMEQEAAVAELAALTTRRNSLAVDAEVAGEGVALFSPALLPENPSGFSLSLILAASAALGFALATALAYGLSLRRANLADKKQPELLLMAPMVGEIPVLQHEQFASGLPIVEQPDSPAAESFRFIAGAISSQQRRVLAAGEEPARVLALASAVADNGRAMVTANTAIAFAQEGHRVLVIDADFDRQGVTSILTQGRKPTVGLTEVIEADLKPLEAIVRIADVLGRDVVLGHRGSIDLIARGGDGVAAPFLFKQSAVPPLVEALAADYDLVVIDSPPLLEVAYSRSVIDLSDATVAVVAHGESMRTVRDFGERLDRAASPLVGYVYNRSNISFDQSRVAT